MRKDLADRWTEKARRYEPASERQCPNCGVLGLTGLVEIRTDSVKDDGSFADWWRCRVCGFRFTVLHSGARRAGRYVANFGVYDGHVEPARIPN
jgi:rubredoxin